MSFFRGLIIYKLPVKMRMGLCRAFLFSLLVVHPVLAANFPHPCVEYNLADLQRMKTNLNVDPWKSGFNVFTNQYASSSNYVMQGPFGSVTRNNTGINTNEAAFNSDMEAAYNLALMWNATGNTNYAANSKTILTAWFTTLTNWISSDGTVGIEVSTAGSTGATAAEILRYTYPGWTSSNTFVCSSFFTNMVWNWIQTNGYGTGNQGMSKIQGMTAVSIFCDNTNWLSITTNIFMTDSCASLTNDSLPSGQNAEEGRDQGHPLGAIGSQLAIANLCWKATEGSSDFYSYLTNRILLEMEYYSTYNMGGTVPYQTFGPCNNSWSTISTASRGAEDASYQILSVKAGYVNRLGVPAPFSMAYANWFPVNQNNFLYENSAVPSIPPAPSGVMASLGYNEVTLSWMPTLGALSYNVLRSTTNGGPYMPVATNFPGTVFADAGVIHGSNYFYVVTATGLGGTSTNSLSISGAPQTLSLPDMDVGSVGATGSAVFSAGTWTVKGAGNDIGGGSDGGNFAYQNQIGDGEVIARLAGATWVGSSGKIGLMMRESTNSDSAEVCLVFDYGASSTPRMFYRMTAGDGNTYNDTALNSSSIPLWLRLKRAGNSFTGYTSVDGTNWNIVASLVIAMPSTINAGLFVCSRSSALATGNFDNVTMPLLTAPSPPNGIIATGGNNQINLIWSSVSGATGYNVKRAPASGGSYTTISTNQSATSYLDTNVVNGTTYFYVVSALNPAGESANSAEVGANAGLPDLWMDVDVGSVGTAGNGTFTSGTPAFTVQGSGNDIGTTADNFNFLFLNLTNNGAIVARLTSATWVGSLGKIGLMIRETTNSSSIYTWIFLDRGSSSSLRMGYRSSTGGNTSFTGSGPSGVTLPEWIKLQRTGNTFTTYYSADGLAWTALGTNTFSSFADPCLVGMAVCSRNSAVATGEFDNVNVPGFAPPAAPTNVNATAVTSSEIDLDWSPVSGATSYKVFRSLTNGGAYQPIASNLLSASYSDISLSGGTTNFYVVTAENIAGDSTSSPQADAVTLPEAPASLVATSGINQVILNWTASFGANGYNLYRATNSGGPYTQLFSGLSATNITDTTVIGGHTYYYVVTALNVSGEGGYSIEASAMPSPSLSPVSLSSQFVGGQLQLLWPADHAGWRLETNTNLLQTNWNNISGADWTNEVEVSATNGSAFFRLIFP